MTASAQELGSIVARLQRSPLHALSLGSHELFFSNVLGWMAEVFPEPVGTALGTWLAGASDGPGAVEVRREWRHLDVVIELPGCAPLVIENKSLAMPDPDQLRRYDTVISDAVAKKQLREPTKVLLSLTDPQWEGGEYRTSADAVPWRWVSYGDLADSLAEQRWDAAGHYAGETVGELIELLRILAALLTSRAARPQPDDPLELPTDTVHTLRRARVHHLVRKARAHHVGDLVRRRLTADGLSGSVRIRTGMTNSMTLVDGLPERDAETDAERQRHDWFQWQIQGGQLRLAVVLPSMSGRTTEARARRVEVAEQNPLWFDFGPAREVLGDRCGSPTGKWLRFDPDFVYRNVKIEDARVSDVVDLGQVYSRRLADAGRPVVNDGA